MKEKLVTKTSLRKKALIMLLRTWDFLKIVAHEELELELEQLDVKMVCLKGLRLKERKTGFVYSGSISIT